MNNNQTFSITHIGAYLHPLLDVLGVVIRAASGEIEEWQDDDGRQWCEVGLIIVHNATGVIEILPRNGISEGDLDLLRGSACDAFMHKPTHKTGYRRRQRKNGATWETVLSTPIN